MKLSEKLIKLRKEKGLSQEEFGNEIGVSRQAVSKWESEQTKPDIDKLKEIAKFFDVTYEYLLNDEIEAKEEVAAKSNEEINNENEKNEEKKKPKGKPKSSSKKNLFKVVFIIIAIYLAFSLYKGSVLLRFYLIANSFSEENYKMYESFTNDAGYSEFSITKYENKVRQDAYWFESLDNRSYEYPNQINYTDYDNKIDYRINYDTEIGKYIYQDMDSIFLEKNWSGYTEEELQYILDPNKNYIKENTLTSIPSNAKDIILSALNPLCLVSLENRTITKYNLTNSEKIKIELNSDCIIESYYYYSDFYGKISCYFSYDYVPDHQKDITDPLEEYKDIIIDEEEIE